MPEKDNPPPLNIKITYSIPNALAREEAEDRVIDHMTEWLRDHWRRDHSRQTAWALLTNQTVRDKRVFDELFAEALEEICADMKDNGWDLSA